MEHNKISASIKYLAFLPLVALGAAVPWYLYRSGGGETAREEKPAPSLPAARPEPAQERDYGPKRLSALDIKGSPAFKGQITGALKLIWMADRETFLFVRENLHSIRNEDKTDFHLDEGHPVAAISDAHAFASMPWCAGIIAHQAFHSFASSSSRSKKKFVPPPPGEQRALRVTANPMRVTGTDLSSLLETERRASEFQLRVMEAAGASRAELRRVRERAARDFSTGHDGNYSLK